MVYSRNTFGVSANIAAAVVSVGMGADNSLMTGEMVFAELLAKRLCHIYGQAMGGYILRVKADDIVMFFYIFPFLIFAIAEICPQTGNCKIFFTTVQRCYSIVISRYEPAVFIILYLRAARSTTASCSSFAMFG